MNESLTEHPFLAILKKVSGKIRNFKFRAFCKRYKNALIFLAGFVFDAVTIKRIDALGDILIQLGYILGLTFLLITQYKYGKGVWSPPRMLEKAWNYNLEALHFLYGGLLSAYVILYFKSSSGSRSLLFFFLLGALLVINEIPQIRRIGHRLRLSLYAFCICSFLIYFIPPAVFFRFIFYYFKSYGADDTPVFCFRVNSPAARLEF